MVRKVRITPYIDPEVKKLLAYTSKSKGLSESDIVNTALKNLLSPDSQDKKEEAFLRKLDKINNNIKGLKRDIEIVAETESMFIRHYLTHSPDIPESQAAAASKIGGAKFKKFTDILKERLSNNKLFTDEIIEEISVTESDFEVGELENV